MNRITLWINGTKMAVAMPLNLSMKIARRYHEKGWRVRRLYDLNQLHISDVLIRGTK